MPAEAPSAIASAARSRSLVIPGRAESPYPPSPSSAGQHMVVPGTAFPDHWCSLLGCPVTEVTRPFAPEGVKSTLGFFMLAPADPGYRLRRPGNTC
jgi:hypothetical protein